MLPRSAGTCTCPCSPARRACSAAMRRRYTREEYLELVTRLRDAMPDIALSTDMIVGFPGETDADFEDTLSLTSGGRAITACSRSSTRHGRTRSPSKRMPDDVTEDGEDATDRGPAGAAAGDSGRALSSRRSAGSRSRCSSTSRSRRRDWELSGRTSGNTVVNFAGDPDWIGRMIMVRVTDANPNSLRAEAVRASASGTDHGFPATGASCKSK